MLAQSTPPKPSTRDSSVEARIDAVSALLLRTPTGLRSPVETQQGDKYFRYTLFYRFGTNAGTSFTLDTMRLLKYPRKSGVPLPRHREYNPLRNRRGKRVR